MAITLDVVAGPLAGTSFSFDRRSTFLLGTDRKSSAVGCTDHPAWVNS